MCQNYRHEYICKICGRNCKSFSSLSKHLIFHGVKTLDYMVQYEGFVIPRCPICGKDCALFPSRSIKFAKTCGSKECFYGLRKITCLKRYGVSNPSQSQKIKDKKRNVCLKKYGVENPFQSEEVKKKIESSNIQKYGCRNPGQSQAIKKKIKETFLKKYGVDCALRADEVKEKIRKSCLEKYGVENPGQSEVVKEKMKATCLELYGVDCSLKSDEIKEKRRKTCLDKYGSAEFFGSVEHRINVLEKSLFNCISRYSEEFDDICIEDLKICGTCRVCGHRQKLNDSVSYERRMKHNITVCTQCNPIHKRYSIKEKGVIEFVKSIYDGPIVENDRTVIHPKELDIYLPEKNLAFEFNGDYWHSDEMIVKRGMPITYHDDKFNACADRGIKLVYIWEHDWDNNRVDVESLIRKEIH